MSGYDFINPQPDKPGWASRVLDQIKQRLNPKTIAQEAFTHLTDKVIPHGADEIGNLMMTGSAYLPWPGAGQTPPSEIAPPAPEQPNTPFEPISVETPSLDAYTSGYPRQPDVGQSYLGIDRAAPTREITPNSTVHGPSDGYLTGRGYEPTSSPSTDGGLHLGDIKRDFDAELNRAASQGKYQQPPDHGLSR